MWEFAMEFPNSSRAIIFGTSPQPPEPLAMAPFSSPPTPRAGAAEEDVGAAATHGLHTGEASSRILRSNAPSEAKPGGQVASWLGKNAAFAQSQALWVKASPVALALR